MSEVSSRTKIIMGLKINRNKKCIMKNKNVEWGRLFLFNYWIWVSFFQWLVYSLNVQYLFIWTTLSVEIMHENIQTCIVTIYLIGRNVKWIFFFVIRNNRYEQYIRFFKDTVHMELSHHQKTFGVTVHRFGRCDRIETLISCEIRAIFVIHSFLIPRCVCRGSTRVTVVVKFLKFDEASHGAKKHGIATHGYYNGQNVSNRINREKCSTHHGNTSIYNKIWFLFSYRNKCIRI